MFWKISAICFLLDDDLTVLEASNFFMRKRVIRKRVSDLFPNDARILPGVPGGLGSYKGQAGIFCGKWRGGYGAECSYAAEKRRFSWVNISLTLTEKNGDGYWICHAVYTDNSTGSMTRQEECRCWKKRAQYFKWVLDEYMDNVYVADMETYELLFVNKTSCDTLGLTLDEVLGHKCYEIIQGRTSPCPFVPINI